MHVCTCAPSFRISGAAGLIALKIGGVRGPPAMHFTQDGGSLLERPCNCTHILAHPSAPSRSSRKRRLTGKETSVVVTGVVFSYPTLIIVVNNSFYLCVVVENNT